ncbi:MAG TPA: carboxypeptidase regulatory-like domain-containing protein [Alloacidobacterium sp.]|nr:carboxypeptidase regulatory-like domain-containing protein [Alloacidobacterium sp.]
MMQRFWRSFVLLLCLACVCSIYSTARAQSTTQGAIAGSVLDANNSAIPNAAVKIHNDGTNAEFDVTADASGYFKAPLLPPGTYTVNISASGFNDLRITPVTVAIGQLTTLQPKLTVGAVSNTVTVSAAAPIINTESPDFASNLNQVAIDNLPINGRRWSDLALLTPGVVADSNGFGLLSVRGISPLLNNVEIDGADDNQAFFSEERGRTREGYSTSQAAVQEFQVNTGVYSAEYGRAAGGVINSITKSGTNDLHGELYFYDRDNNWGAFNPFTTTSVYNPATNTISSGPYKPKDWRKEWGLAIGGPLVKDKLFWFYAYDQYKRNFPGTAKPSSPNSFFAFPDAPTTSAGDTVSVQGVSYTCNTATGYLAGPSSSSSAYALDASACALAARANLGSYGGGVTAYENGLIGLLSNLGSVPRTGDQVINTPKIDWQITDREHASFLYHRLRWDSPGGVQTQATNNYAIDTFGTDFVKLDYGLARLDSVITNSLTNEIRFQYGRELNDEGQQPYSAYTQQHLVGAGGNVPEVALATSSGFYMGSPYYSYRVAYPDERKWQIGDTAAWTHGNHSLKFGFDLVHNFDLQNNTYESNGYISYSYIGNYFADMLSAGGPSSTCNSTASQYGSASSSAVGTYPCYSSFVQGFGPSVFSLATLDQGYFVQDTWKVSPRLTLDLGVRYDYENLPGPYANLLTASGSFVPYGPSTSGLCSGAVNGCTDVAQQASLFNHPSDKNNFGPRVGFAYNVFGNGNTVLRGGYGMYYGRVFNAMLLNTYYNTGSPLGQFTASLKPNASGAPKFPNIISAANPPKPSSDYFAKNFQNPMVHEWDLTLQQGLPHSTVFSLSYLGALGRELPNYLNINLNPNPNTNPLSPKNTTPNGVVNSTITVVDPTGKGPLANGSTFVVPTYTSYINPSFQAVTEVVSNINSSYHAMVAEIQNNSSKFIQFDANYTWSHAMDFNQNQSTAPGTNGWLDPYGNARANYANSNFNVPNRFVGWAVINLPNTQTQTWYKWLANNWSVNPIVQAQNGLPYSATISSGYNSYSALNSGWNGAGSVYYIPQIGRNTFQQRRTAVIDIRAEKQFTFHEKYNLQLVGEAFNLFNHVNVTSVNTGGYILSSGSSSALPAETSTLTYQTVSGTDTPILGQITNANSNYVYSPRQVQVAVRFEF